MADFTSFATARALRAVCILAPRSIALALGLMIAAPAIWATNPSTPVGSGISVSASSVVAASKPAPKISKLFINPTWSELSPSQQNALAPLAAEWDKLDSLRKKKWLKIGKEYAQKKPDEQQRMQEKMREWAKMTPEQRRVVRENYSLAKKITPTQKSEKWQQYQQLPEDQKSKLAADATVKKSVTNLPPASQAKSKTVLPIKLINKSANGKPPAAPGKAAAATAVPAATAPAASAPATSVQTPAAQSAPPQPAPAQAAGQASTK